MLDKDPGLPGWVTALLAWMSGHPYVSWGGLTAFLVALWSSLRDGRGWLWSIFGAVLSVLITLSVLAVMRNTGLHEEWMPVIGLAIGFIGADRIRAAILRLWYGRRAMSLGQSEHE